ncbi:class I SAM-dependent methyltransferase [Francisella marina]|uniref:Methyltransferase domain-containing protein n=1 Tax=Francisella marina TaxID=2249302 RepID=A0ABX5ZKH8_9GAMM|nr:class I SAM-dependent methyltransferase [Francisella marina]QEO57919.1 hypothetical protein F0R74_08695 [Francisella marina]QEO59854.1 hypothetical protein F0R75_08620 [Francisella marina]
MDKSEKNSISYFDAHIRDRGPKAKVSDKWELYLREYDRVLQPYCNKKVNIFEIGVQNGGSLEVLAKHFPLADKIIGCDIDERCASLKYSDNRVSIIIGDASSIEVTNKVSQLVDSLNIIIDDGSHKSGDIVKSFTHFFPLLNEGGIYIVEDLHCSYWEEFEGGIYHPFSSMSFFKALTDYINREHFGIKSNPKMVLDEIFDHYDCNMKEFDLAGIHSIEFINSMCVISKKSQRENILGREIVSGNSELIVPGRLAKNNSESTPLNQEANIWNISYNQQIINLKNHIVEKDSQLAHKDNLMISESAKLNSTIAEKNQQITEKDKLIAEKDFQLTHKDSVIINESIKFSNTIIEKDKQITEKDKLIAEKDKLIAEKDKLIAEKNRQITEKNKLLSNVYKSFSWRITKVFRLIPRGVRVLRRGVGKIKALKSVDFKFLVSQLIYRIKAIIYSPIRRLSNARSLNFTKRAKNKDVKVAVVYLARGNTPKELDAINKFIASYEKYSSGLNHSLYIIFKGFENESAINNIKHKIAFKYKAFHFDDDGYDIGSYMRITDLLKEDLLLFLNTYSRICAKNWVYKMAKPLLYKNNVGIVGATSSFESLASISEEHFPKAPNAHIRSNGFAIGRANFKRIIEDINISNKIDALCFESGYNSMTNKLKALGKKAVIVDKYGNYFFESQWHLSGVFRNIFVKNYLICDNRHDEFSLYGFSKKVSMAFCAWGKIR